jgi:hypothetical protein
MSVEKPSLEEAIALCETEAEKRKWFEGTATVLKGLKGIKREQEQAERARDEALQAKDAALKEIAATRAKYEADMKAAFVDLARITKEKTDAAEREVAQARAELATVKTQTEAARQAKALAEGQRDAFKADADRQAAALVARNQALMAEERTIRGRLEAALKT